MVLLLLLCPIILLSSWDLIYSPRELQDSHKQQQVLHFKDAALTIVEEGSVVNNHDVPVDVAPFFFARLDGNQVDAELLQIIPGIGPKIAEKIIQKRNELGTFTSFEQLLDVPGIGIKRLELLKRWLTFE